ncbi:SPOR domain-containing protein [uncultured Psychrosphaera sp.]|uniref:SPOR domain-containing protein n=1 Tax=uncultured Psychrosphaera sp. TaxID=1403522 RepID=UPI00261ADBB8|nr:SPOR domain-containing protein [uncultured Psychrosphaera sp.]
MTNLIKQRIVGLLLVLIAGIVFLPDLLDGEKQQTKEEFKKIPIRPEVEESPIVSDFPTEEVLNAIKKAPQVIEIKADDETEKDVADAKSIESKPVEDKKTKTVVTKVVPVKPIIEVKPVKADFKKDAWILQLGSFKHKGNVDALEKRLKKAGFKVFIRPIETKSGILSKVFVGPELERKDLEEAQKTLKELTGLNGTITKFVPIN